MKYYLMQVGAIGSGLDATFNLPTNHRGLVRKIQRTPILSSSLISHSLYVTIPSTAIERSVLSFHQIRTYRYEYLRGNIKRRCAAISVKLWNCIYKNQILNSRPKPETAGSKRPQAINDIPNVEVPVASHETAH